MQSRTGWIFTTVFLGLTPFQVSAAIAQESAVDVSADAGASTHAKSLAAPQWIGRNVWDPDGNRLGEIESVLVNGAREASSVILDIGGWLEPNEHIRVRLVDLRMNESGADCVHPDESDRGRDGEIPLYRSIPEWRDTPRERDLPIFPASRVRMKRSSFRVVGGNC
jgi:hypothetical protein